MEKKELKILVVEDDSGMAHATVAYLERNGYTAAQSVANVSTAIMRLPEFKQGLVLADLWFSGSGTVNYKPDGLSGRDLVAYAKKKYKSIKIVVLYGDIEDWGFDNLPVDGWVLKTELKDKLLPLIEELFPIS